MFTLFLRFPQMFKKTNNGNKKKINDLSNVPFRSKIISEKMLQSVIRAGCLVGNLSADRKKKTRIVKPLVKIVIHF